MDDFAVKLPRLVGDILTAAVESEMIWPAVGT